MGAPARQCAWSGHKRNGHPFKYLMHDVIFTWQYSTCSTCAGIKLPLSCTVSYTQPTHVLLEGCSPVAQELLMSCSQVAWESLKTCSRVACKSLACNSQALVTSRLSCTVAIFMDKLIITIIIIIIGGEWKVEVSRHCWWCIFAHSLQWLTD